VNQADMTFARRERFAPPHHDIARIGGIAAVRRLSPTFVLELLQNVARANRVRKWNSRRDLREAVAPEPPFETSDFIALAIPAIIPALPLLTTVMPLTEILKDLFRLVA
jgi:hypothetical protein